MMKFYNLIMLIFSLFILSSCASYIWVSDTKSADLLDRDLTNCQHWANTQFPPQMVSRIKTEMTPITHRSYSRHYSEYESVTYVPIQSTELVDINASPRETALKKCMTENDWRLELAR